MNKTTTLSTLQQQTLALAGVFQAAVLVRKIATTGDADPKAFAASLNSLFVFDPLDVPQVYGDTQALAEGLRALCYFLRKESPRDKLVVRYVTGMIHLQKLVVEDRDMTNIIHRRLTRTALHLAHLTVNDSTIITTVANIYTENLSQLRYRIPIYGHSNYLQQPECINKVRALLFAGLRSALLWRQVGGSYWKILWYRKRLLKLAAAFLQD